jgi:hypothetical protein
LLRAKLGHLLNMLFRLFQLDALLSQFRLQPLKAEINDQLRHVTRIDQSVYSSIPFKLFVVEVQILDGLFPSLEWITGAPLIAT